MNNCRCLLLTIPLCLLVALASATGISGVNQTHSKKVVFVVGVQAGHSGHDSGAICEDNRRLTEVSITEAVANRAAALLRRLGYHVDLLTAARTRSNQWVARGYSANAFVALHVDFCEGVSNGYKVARWNGVNSDGTDGSGDPSDHLVQDLWQHYGAATSLARDEAHITGAMRNYYALNPRTGIDRTTPGAILEMGWLSGDRSYITSTAGQLQMARGVCNAIQAFLNRPRRPGT